ncbi:MAG: hypothetical protein K2W96_16510 [Gemmataceae bacterium]|nr:hypothetical protein [Gemmataceae bacterium]
MTVEEFEAALTGFIHREPFVPFVVELNDGSIIEVDHPGVAFNGPAAVFMTDKTELVSFRHDSTRAIREAVPEVAR